MNPNRTFLTCRLVSAGLIASVAYVASPVSLSASEMTRAETQFWSSVYESVNPDAAAPSWPAGGPHAWAKLEKDAVDKVVAEVLRGERNDIPWRLGMFAARVIQGPAICHELWVRFDQVSSAPAAGIRPWAESDCAASEGLVHILARCEDVRMVPALNSILASDTCSERSTLAFLAAARRLGDESALTTIEQLTIRQRSDTINREALLAERIIRRRLKGIDETTEAQKELRDLMSRFANALEQRDLQAYVTCMPVGFRNVIDEKDMHEVVAKMKTHNAVTGLRAALQKQTVFNIEINDLRATLRVEPRLLLECVLEADGWKVANLRPLVQEGKAGEQ